MVKRNDLNLEPAILHPAPNLAFDNTGQQLEAKAKVESLGKLNVVMNEWADKEAIMAGTEDGLKAGLKSDFKPLRGTGLYSQAFDKAGVSTYANEVEIKANADSQRLFEQYKNDPVTLEKMYATSGDAAMSSLPDEVKPTFRQIWASRTSVGLTKAKEAHEARVIDAYKASTIAAAEQQRNHLLAAAETLDDAQFEAVLKTEVPLYINRFTSVSPRNSTGDVTGLPVFTNVQIQEINSKLAEDLFIHKAVGKFNKAQDKDGFIGEFEKSARSSGDMSPEVIDRTVERLSRINSGIRAEENRVKSKVAEDEVYNIQLGIRSHDPNIDPKYITDRVESGAITKPMATSLLNHYDVVNKERIEMQEVADSIQTAIKNSIPVDRNNPKVMKYIDADYRQFTQELSGKMPNGSVLTEDVKATRIVDYVAKRGVVPNLMVNEISSKMRSGDPLTLANTSDMIGRIVEHDQRLATDFRKDDILLANSINNYTRIGAKPDQAVASALQLWNVPAPVKEERKTAFEKTGLKALYSLDKAKSDLRSAYSGTFEKNSRLYIPDEIISEFNEVVKDNFIKTGDIKLATQTAIDVMKQEAGVSTINQGIEIHPGKPIVRQFFRHDPNKLFRLGTDITEEKNNQYIRMGVADDLRENGIDVDVSKILFNETPATTRNNGTYELWVSDNGVVSPLMDKDLNIIKHTIELDKLKDKYYKDITSVVDKPFFEGGVIEGLKKGIQENKDRAKLK